MKIYDAKNDILIIFVLYAINRTFDASKKTLVSFEVLPPLKGRSISYIYEHLDPLMKFKPSWINVTYHRSETINRKNKAGVEEKVDVRKRPGTVGICAAIMNHYNVDAVPQIICGGFQKEKPRTP